MPTVHPNLEAVIANSIAEATADPAAEVDAGGEESSSDVETSEDSAPASTAETIPETIVETIKPVESEVSKSVETAKETGKEPPKVETVDEFAKEHGLTPKKADGRENWMPYSRVKKISENAALKATKAAEERHTPVVSKLTADLKDRDIRLEKIATVEKIMFNDAPRMVEILKTIPGYKALLEAATTQPASPAQSVDAPGPDGRDTAGNPTYTLEGFQKRLAWERTEAKKEAVAEAKAEMDRRLGPIESERQQAEALAKQRADLIPRVEAMMQRASTWKGFNENIKEILPLVNQGMELGEAYSQIMVPKFEADNAKIKAESQKSRQQLRDEILAEIAKAPRSTAAGGTGSPNKAAETVSGGPRSLEDVIKQSIAGLR